MADPPQVAQQGPGFPQAAKLPIIPVHAYLEHPGDATAEFRQWLGRFQLYLNSISATLPHGQVLSEMQKSTYLCANLGTEGYRIFCGDPIIENIQNMDDATTYDMVKAAATAVFGTRITRAKAVYDFHRRLQEPDESVDEYLTRLRSMATDCQFGDLRNDNIKLQLIEGCANERAQKELLAMEDPDLDRVLNFMQANETELSGRNSSLELIPW